MHRDFCIRRGHCAVRLLASATQGVRHNRARVPLDFGAMAKLAAACASGLAQQLESRDLRIGGGWKWAGLSAPRGNNLQKDQNDEQQIRNTSWQHESAGSLKFADRRNCTATAL